MDERPGRIAAALLTALLAACVLTSFNWQEDPAMADGELLRLDRVYLFGQAGIFHLAAAALFAALFLVKLAPGGDRDPRRLWGRPNFARTLLWLFFVPLNVLIYLTVAIQGLPLPDLGLAPVIEFGSLLVILYFIQDVVLERTGRAALDRLVMTFQALVLLRAAYTIGKSWLGYGVSSLRGGGIRMGQENDLADFFVLLFALSLSRRLLAPAASRAARALDLAGIAAPVFVAFSSERRYFQAEVLIAAGAIGIAWLRRSPARSRRAPAAVGLALTLAFGALLAVGPGAAAKNPIVGRLASSLALFSDRYESEFGTETGHREEIRDGWRNVRANWLLGVTPFGQERVVKTEAVWQGGYYVHNAYLFIWQVYGLFGLGLFLAFYGLSLRLGVRQFRRFGDPLGLALAVFLACQLVKNVVWVTAFYYLNITIVYLFAVSVVARAAVLSERGAAAAPAAARRGSPS